MTTTTAKKNKPLEDKVLAALADGPKTNRELREALRLPGDQYDPALDRTLQAMRKGGRIHLLNRRWAPEHIVLCIACGGRGWAPQADPKAGALTCGACGGKGWVKDTASRSGTR